MKNHLNKFTITCFLFACGFTTPILSQDNSLEQNIKEYLKLYVVNQDFAGALLIAKDGEIIVNEGFGLASYELDVKNTEFQMCAICAKFRYDLLLKL